MTDKLLHLISSKNSNNLHKKDNSLVSLNTEINGTNLWPYFESKMAENKCKMTPDPTVNLILTHYLDQPHLGLVGLVGLNVGLEQWSGLLPMV